MKKEKAPFSESENELNAEQQQKIEIPEELQCSLCKNLLQDAVLVPCCGNSFCDECNFIGRFINYNIIIYLYSLKLSLLLSLLLLSLSLLSFFPFNKQKVVVLKKNYLFISH